MLATRMNMTVMTPALVGGTGRQWTEGDSLRLAMLIGAFIVAVVVLGIVILVVRRRLFVKDHEMAASRSLMDQLREMRDRGEMSDEEYERTRKALANKVAAEFKKPSGNPAGPERASPGGRSVRMNRMGVPQSGVEAKVARPGYDLTGEPLPGGKQPGSSAPPTPPLPPGYADA